MEFASALILVLGLHEAAYDPVADRARFPPDAVLLGWIANNTAYQEFLAQTIAQIDDPLHSMRTRYNNIHIEQLRQYLEDELVEACRIRSAMYSPVGLSPSSHSTMWRTWMLSMKRNLTPAEYAAGYFPYGGYPEPDWRLQRR
jgi:hypothetical protein